VFCRKMWYFSRKIRIYYGCKVVIIPCLEYWSSNNVVSVPNNKPKPAVLTADALSSSLPSEIADEEDGWFSIISVEVSPREVPSAVSCHNTDDSEWSFQAILSLDNDEDDWEAGICKEVGPLSPDDKPFPLLSADMVNHALTSEVSDKDEDAVSVASWPDEIIPANSSNEVPDKPMVVVSMNFCAFIPSASPAEVIVKVDDVAVKAGIQCINVVFSLDGNMVLVPASDNSTVLSAVVVLTANTANGVLVSKYPVADDETISVISPGASAGDASADVTCPTDSRLKASVTPMKAASIP
jgi:hypothetical protein